MDKICELIFDQYLSPFLCMPLNFLFPKGNPELKLRIVNLTRSFHIDAIQIKENSQVLIQENGDRENSVHFALFNRNYENGTKLTASNKDVTKFIEGRPLVVVTHGWISSADSPAVAEIVRDVFQTQEVLSQALIQQDGDRGNVVHFELFNRNYENGTNLTASYEDVIKFIEGRPLVVVTHGWTRDADSPSVMEIVSAYLKFYYFNVVTADWSELANEMYFSAAAATGTVGKAIGSKLVEFCKEMNVCRFEDTHLIGHSLGAHAMGRAGEEVQNRTGEKVRRITGLDPAGPMFEFSLKFQDRLDKTDAVFVDVIHTDSLIGYRGELGHTDFYPNGGNRPQPGCELTTEFFCSHKRGFQYYAESIVNSDSFLSTLCGSYLAYISGQCEGQETVHMGESAPSSARGSFYLTTSRSSPYSN